MKVTPLAIPDVLRIEPKVFGDARGFFFESFNRQSFKQATGLEVDFVQDNHSRSVRHVLRGLHYQLPPRAQGKLVRVVAGEVFDVAVDIRPESPTVFWYSAKRPSSSTKRPITGRRNWNAASAGTIRS